VNKSNKLRWVSGAIVALLGAGAAQASETAVIGPIESVSPKGPSLTVLGQTFFLGSSTGTTPPELGAYVAIVGETATDGRLIAKSVALIDSAYVPGASSVLIRATVDKFDASLGALKLGGAKILVTEAFANGTIVFATGDTVEIVGTQAVPSGTVWASKLTSAPGPISVEAIVGTGTQSRAIVGTGVSTRAIVGTGKQSLAIVGTGATARAIVGTGRQSRAIVGTGMQAQAIVGTGRQTQAIVGTGRQIQAIVGTGKEAQAIVGTGASTQAIVGTGRRAQAIVGTGRQIQAIVGTGRQSLAIVGTGSQANSIVGTGKRVQAIVGTGASARAIVGTGK
jgi:hypothetical protein